MQQKQGIPRIGWGAGIAHSASSWFGQRHCLINKKEGDQGRYSLSVSGLHMCICSCPACKHVHTTSIKKKVKEKYWWTCGWWVVPLKTFTVLAKKEKCVRNLIECFHKIMWPYRHPIMKAAAEPWAYRPYFILTVEQNEDLVWLWHLFTDSCCILRGCHT